MFTTTATITTSPSSTTNNMPKSTTTTTTAPATATTTLAHTRLWLLALQLLLLSCVLPLSHHSAGVVALPITSKPIEGTAENLAWQAWLMLPPEQKQLEKSRKVTPKSIFSLPFRDCPPGHQLFQSRCIPTVNINQSELLTQQLLGLFVDNKGAAGASNAYEFDYEYDELSVGDGGEEPVLLYESAQRFNGGDDVSVGAGVGSGNAAINFDESSSAGGSSSAQQPPHSDEPLKFNLFQQKFPTSDYETDSGAIEGSGGARPPPLPESMSSALFNATQFLDAVQGLLQRHAPANVSVNATAINGSSGNLNTSINYNNTGFYYNKNYTHSGNNTAKNNSNNTGLNDQQTSSSNNFFAATLATVVAPPPKFAFSDIDAIVLPASASPSASAMADLAPATNLEPQRVSLFKDDSAVQLVTTVIDHRQEQSAEPSKASLAAEAISGAPQVNIAQLLRDDALLPLAQAADTANTNVAPTERIAVPTALALGSGVSTWFGTPLPLSAQAESSSVEYVVTEPTKTTTMENAYTLVEKDERPRSVTQRNAAAADTEAQEVGFTTTVEPESTTNFQIDETTIIEATGGEWGLTHDTELLEAILHAQAKQPVRENEREQKRRVLKKSKVEPVDETTMSARTAAAATAAGAEIAITETAATTNTMNAKIAIATETAIETTTTTAVTATPLPSALTTTTTKAEGAAAESADRFGSATNNQLVGVALSDAQQRSGSDLVNAHSDSNSDTNKHSNKNNSSKNSNENNNNNSDNDSNSKNSDNNKDVDSKKSPKTSEINIEQEFRMINELVKGKTQSAALKMATDNNDAETTATTQAAEVPAAITTTTAAKATTTAKTTEVATEKTESRRSIAEVANKQRTVATDSRSSSSSSIITTTATSGRVGTTSAAKMSATKANAAKMPAKTTKEHLPTTAAIIESEGDAAATTTRKSNTASATTTTDAALGSTTQATTAASEPSSTLWSRILPILGFGSATAEEAGDATTIPIKMTTTTMQSPSTAATTTTASVAASRPHPALSSSISISTSDATNRSNRNSKIIRIDELSENSVANAIDANTRFAAAAATTTTQATATVEVPPGEQLEQSSTNPFWWLPAGWRLDRRVNDDQHLLLRFWSAFPESQLKAKVSA